MDMTYKLGVLGKEISYSLSPKIHNLFSKQSNIDIDYKIYDIEKDSLSFIDNFFKNGGHGLNITQPFKEEVGKFYNSPPSNLLYKKNNCIKADSVDAEGLFTDLVKKNIMVNSGTRILLLGLGGAGISIINSSIFNQCNFVVWNRTKNKYKNIQREFVEFKDNNDKKIDLVISCVSQMNNEISEIILNTNFQEFAHIYDINYKNETNTHYKKISLKKNAVFNSGEGMLIEQAALSWMRWFDNKPDTSYVEARIENERI
jgi:shikimate dehydrogenase